PLDQLPLFVKTGAVIPMQPKMQYVDEFEPEAFTLHIYAGEKTTTSTLYEDDGHSKDFERGLSTIRKFVQKHETNYISITQIIEGDYESSFQSFEALLHTMKEIPKSITVDGKSVSFIQENNNIKFIVNKSFREIKIET
ncbi:MAG: DUF5110 domain-containing protein, partial [Fulvivirga sp.]|uniref:DUF5110 domain-containing protein n=1 Tax=Fulvivirga sp. TaxID=1931237 RepID=UPI0032ECC5A5